MENKNNIIFISIFIIVIAGLIALFVYMNGRNNNPTGQDLTAFTQCLKDRGATFYGAFWCPHCAATKNMFGPAKANLPYVECSTPDGNGQTQICIDKKVERYPTWEFADGTRETGELTLEYLSQKTGCPLPGQEFVQQPLATSTQVTSTSSSSVAQ